MKSCWVWEMKRDASKSITTPVSPNNPSLSASLLTMERSRKSDSLVTTGTPLRSLSPLLFVAVLTHLSHPSFSLSSISYLISVGKKDRAIIIWKIIPQER
jgi:hypothetical protein